MLTLSDQLTEVYGETGLTSTSKSRITSRLNDYLLQICGEKDWKWLEETFTITTVANTSIYNLDIRNLQVKTVWLYVSATDKRVPLREIVNPTEWRAIINRGATSSGDYPYLYHIEEGQIEIFPKSSTAGYSLKVLCLLNPQPMEVEDYTTGSIAVTNGDATVTGTGTLWDDNIKAGCKIKVNRIWYEVSSVTDDTHLELTQEYQGATESGITDYKIGDSCPIPQNYQSILWKMYCEEYYAKNINEKRRSFYENMVAKQRLGLDKLSGSQTTTNIWDNNPPSTDYFTFDPYVVHAD